MSEDNTNNDMVTEVQVIDTSALAATLNVEIDKQIATAHQFPRSLTQFKRKAMEMATLDEETAKSCLYALPRKDKGQVKMIEGESIRMAEIVAASYGNLRVQARVVSQTATRGTVQAVCHDLENNVAILVEKQFRTTYKSGTAYNEDMQIVATNAAMSKALRDAIFRVVPKSMIKTITNAAKQLAWGGDDGKAKSMSQRRAELMKWLKSLGIDLKRVWTALNIGGEDDIGLEELGTLAGLYTAIRDRDTTIDEAFPAIVNIDSMTGGIGVSQQKQTDAAEPEKKAEDATQAKDGLFN